jgi:hypothetical protein
MGISYVGGLDAFAFTSADWDFPADFVTLILISLE